MSKKESYLDKELRKLRKDFIKEDKKRKKKKKKYTKWIDSDVFHYSVYYLSQTTFPEKEEEAKDNMEKILFFLIYVMSLVSSLVLQTPKYLTNMLGYHREQREILSSLVEMVVVKVQVLRNLRFKHGREHCVSRI